MRHSIADSALQSICYDKPRIASTLLAAGVDALLSSEFHDDQYRPLLRSRTLHLR
jgi:hypothetical protein